MRRHFLLAIDGPAGTGKTTSARLVAERLGFAYIDSGALYRAIAVAARARGIDSPEDGRLRPLLMNLPLRAKAARDGFRVYLGGEEVTTELRDPRVSALASKLAVDPSVRGRVEAWLKELAGLGPSVVEGRDIGTDVFPGADLKIFLTASLEARAERRSLELREKGLDASAEDVAAAIVERDRRDSERSVAPLRQAPDAVVIDTTALDVEGQILRIIGAWERFRPRRPRFFYRIEQWSIRTFAGLFWGLRVEGAERVPRGGPVILAANHKSYLDPPLIGALLPREIHYLAKRQLFDVPLFGAWVRASNAIPIDREGFDRRGIERALETIRAGNALLVFPEGTRIRREGLGPPKEGIAMLIARAGCAVIPVRLKGTWKGERRGAGRRGITVRFGEPLLFPPVPPGREGRSRFPEIAARVMESIAAAGAGRDEGPGRETGGG